MTPIPPSDQNIARLARGRVVHIRIFMPRTQFRLGSDT